MHQILIILGNSPFFASRAFLPALILILTYRFHEHIPFIDVGGTYTSNESWIFSDAAMYSFIILSILEFLAIKNQDVREFLEAVMSKLRIIVAAAINFSLLTPETVAIMEQAHLAGFSLWQILAIVSGAIVHTVGLIRQEIFELIQDFDEDDDFKLQLGITFLEDIVIIVGIVLLIAIPLLVIGLTLFILLLIKLQQRHYAKVEDATRVECSACRKRILPAATECFSCATIVAAPKELGLLGQMTGKINNKPEQQRLHLLEARRCPHCAEKLPKNNMSHVCTICHKIIRKEDHETLLATKKKHLPLAYIGLTLAGLVPVIGMVCAILYMKFTFIKPLKQYLPSNSSFWNRIVINILTFFMMFIQAIPFAGALVPPLLLFINYSVWERSYKKGIEKSFADE